MSARYGKVRCPKCHVWYGLDDKHTCSIALMTPADVLAVALPAHGLALPQAIVWEQDRLTAYDYRRRIANEDARIAEHYGVEVAS